MSWLDEKIQMRAVAAGVAVDWIGTSLFIAVIWIILGFSGVVDESDVETLVDSTGFLLFGTAVGILFTSAGGWVVCPRRLSSGASKERPVMLWRTCRLVCSRRFRSWSTGSFMN